MKTKVKIIDGEERVTGTGVNFTRFVTSQGNMNCFDGELANDIKKCYGTELVLEFTESKDGKFKNIIGASKPELANYVEEKKTGNKQNQVSAGVALRFAVDMFIKDKITSEQIPQKSKEMLSLLKELENMIL